ncbi:4Fe-4S binding protein [Raineyella fluvialis]|uniref:4Fe-4S dicluster domain-containing protein n=1 Tax=Raineyella fluvialis TaxID=2662261 RepID=A0A5Q2FBJ4_9ACTN|nr:4Fe-4S binding protein [Raineyella fluvialis]QGF22784.1 4Fe-4S dicluster domain-containing protein [Raineyella fluvialis]
MTATHGRIRLIEDRCTSCMICARECPVWCISIDAHTEPDPASEASRRPRLHNVLDRFAIDWSVCMYCGICVDECPFDALEWNGEHVSPGASLPDLVHQRDRLAPDPGGRPTA